MEQIPHENEAFRAPKTERKVSEETGPNTPENTSKPPYFDANSTAQFDPNLGTDPQDSAQDRRDIGNQDQTSGTGPVVSDWGAPVHDAGADLVEGRTGEEQPRASTRSGRARSPLRLKYEAETELIRRKLGDLEDIRRTLGLSQRKMCQLLFVDPSAWTRWTKSGEHAPPHIYRMLQWYLALQEKYPALDVNFWLQTVAQTRNPQENDARDRRIAELSTEQARLQEELRQLRVFSGHNLMTQSREVEKASQTLSSQFQSQLGHVERKSKQQLWIAVAAALGAGALLRGLWGLFVK